MVVDLNMVNGGSDPHSSNTPEVSLVARTDIIYMYYNFNQLQPNHK